MTSDKTDDLLDLLASHLGMQTGTNLIAGRFEEFFGLIRMNEEQTARYRDLYEAVFFSGAVGALKSLEPVMLTLTTEGPDRAMLQFAALLTRMTDEIGVYNEDYERLAALVKGTGNTSV